MLKIKIEIEEPNETALSSLKEAIKNNFNLDSQIAGLLLVMEVDTNFCNAGILLDWIWKDNDVVDVKCITTIRER